MKKLYHLSTCNTCQKIIKEWGAEKSCELQNIKEKNISAIDLDKAAKALGSYQALFSRRAIKFRAMGLDKIKLTEKDYRRLILQEYTFLKRPVLFNDNEIFAGNSKTVVAAAKMSLKKNK